MGCEIVVEDNYDRDIVVVDNGPDVVVVNDAPDVVVVVDEPAYVEEVVEEVVVVDDGYEGGEINL